MAQLRTNARRDASPAPQFVDAFPSILDAAQRRIDRTAQHTAQRDIGLRIYKLLNCFAQGYNDVLL